MKKITLLLILGISLALAYDLKTCKNLANKIEQQYNYRINVAINQKDYADSLAYQNFNNAIEYDPLMNIGGYRGGLGDSSNAALQYKASQDDNLIFNSAKRKLELKSQLVGQLRNNSIEYERALNSAEIEREHNYNQLAIDCKISKRR